SAPPRTLRKPLRVPTEAASRRPGPRGRHEPRSPSEEQRRALSFRDQPNRSQVIAVPFFASLAILLPRSISRYFVGRPNPGRIGRTFSRVSTSPAFTSLTI